MSEIIYQCGECGRQASTKKGDPAPQCCQKVMKPLPFCTTAPHPEMARNYEADEPCDDGTLPKNRK